MRPLFALTFFCGTLSAQITYDRLLHAPQEPHN